MQNSLLSHTVLFTSEETDKQSFSSVLPCNSPQNALCSTDSTSTSTHLRPKRESTIQPIYFSLNSFFDLFFTVRDDLGGGMGSRGPPDVTKRGVESPPVRLRDD